MTKKNQNRELSIKNNLKTYQGESCHKGHLGIRRIHNHECMDCMREYLRSDRGHAYKRAKQRQLKEENPFRYKFNQLRHNAKTRKILWSISFEDFCMIPMDRCPVFNTKLNLYNDDMFHNATLDRTNSAKGYEIGNVVWMSWRANVIKGNYSLYEIKAVEDYLKTLEENEL